MKGQYKGKDGRTFEASGISIFGGSFTLYPGDDDFPAARAALDELIEGEKEEWVEIAPGYLVKRDGEYGVWSDDKAPLCNVCEGAWVQAYRKGLEVGAAKEREKVKELVEAVLAKHDCYSTSEDGVTSAAWSGAQVDLGWLGRVTMAAEALRDA